MHDITLRTRDVATGHLAEKLELSGGKEIEELEDAFNQMVEHIQSLTEEINRVAYNNCENDSTEAKNMLSTGNAPIPSQTSMGNIGEMGLPKGLHQATLGQIVQFLQANRRPLSAEEVAEGVNLTRVTYAATSNFLNIVVC